LEPSPEEGFPKLGVSAAAIISKITARRKNKEPIYGNIFVKLEGSIFYLYKYKKKIKNVNNSQIRKCEIMERGNSVFVCFIIISFGFKEYIKVKKIRK
jgi:hypothetical protein